MSYVRFGKDSDVYVYGDINDREGEVRCCACRLPFLFVPQGGIYDPPMATFIARGPSEMILHLEEHAAAGQKVPKRAYTRLRAEAKTRKPIRYHVHLAERLKPPLSFVVPKCGYDYSAHCRGLFGRKWRRENPNGHAHPRDEMTTNKKRVTCPECRKRMRHG